MPNYQYFNKLWFAEATPQNGAKATCTLTISSVVSDAQTVTIGTKVYEFDTNNTYTAGRVQVDISNLRNQATGTLTFSGVPIVTQTVTISLNTTVEVYEFVAAAGDIAVPTNIPVVLGGTNTADNAVTKLAEAISANSTIVDATFSTVNDTVTVVSDARGTAGNSISTTETCANASWSGATLSGGLATITAANAVTALVAAITANDTNVDAADGADDTVVLTAKYVGDEYNSVATTETMANGSFGAATLTGGQYAPPVASPAILIVSDVIYVADAPVSKWSTNGWRKGTLTTA